MVNNNEAGKREKVLDDGRDHHQMLEFSGVDPDIGLERKDSLFGLTAMAGTMCMATTTTIMMLPFRFFRS